MQALTRVSHELARDFLVAAAAAEDLSAQAAVVATAERGELLIAVIALLTLAVRHPVLFQITVLWHTKKTLTYIHTHNPSQINYLTKITCALMTM